MLTIRAEQIQAFDNAALARFARRVADQATLRRLGPRYSGEPNFLQEVGMILRNGLGIGLTSEVELARYTFLILRMERSTHRSEHWRGVWEALADGNLEPAERLEAAYRAWRIVQRASNKS